MKDDEQLIEYVHAPGVPTLSLTTRKMTEEEKRGTRQPCCMFDTDRDGNCAIHSAPGVLRRGGEGL